MNARRIAAAVWLVGLLMGAVSLPVSALLHNATPATRIGVTVPGPQVAKAAVPRPAPTGSGLLLELKDPALYPGYERQVAQAPPGHGFIGFGRVYVHGVDASSLTAFH